MGSSVVNLRLVPDLGPAIGAECGLAAEAIEVVGAGTFIWHLGSRRLLSTWARNSVQRIWEYTARALGNRRAWCIVRDGMPCDRV